jgi:hypothetical protein
MTVRRYRSPLRFRRCARFAQFDGRELDQVGR